MSEHTPGGEIGIGVIGFGWMGRVHARAYARLRHHFPELPLTPRLLVVADPVADRLEAAGEPYRFERTTTDWRQLLDHPRVQAVSVTVPNWLHGEIGVAVAQAGKHLWIEKPVGRDAGEAQAVAAAVAAAGVQSTVGFNYRNVPAVAYALELIGQGRIGVPTHARFHLLSDYAAHPQSALSWRFTRAGGGSGVLGDLASHAVDLARHLLGEIDSVVADEAVFIPERPEPAAPSSHFAADADGAMGAVENEDYVGCLLRFASGARATLEASRVSVGEQNNYGFEIHGTMGSVIWDFRRMGELGVCLGESYQNQSFTTVFAGPGHGSYEAFQPGAGIAMGYDDLKVVEAANFLRSIAEGVRCGPTIDDGVRAALALDAITESIRTGSWTRVPRWPAAAGASDS
jgi:predicted dehydrogenase